MGIFDGLKQAQVFEQGNYLSPGSYDVKITRCLVKQTLRSGIGFIAELEIVASSNPKHPVGSKASWFQAMTKNQATAFSAIKEFIIAVWGLNLKTDAARIASELEPNVEAIMDSAIGAQNTLGGRLIHVECFIKKTREKQTDFTVHQWTPYTGAPIEMRAEPAAPPQQQFQAPPQQFQQPFQATPPQQQQFQQQFQAPPPMPPQQQFQAPPPMPPQQQFQAPPPQFQAAPPPFQVTPPPQQAYHPAPVAGPPPGPPPTPIYDPATGGWRMP